MGVRDRFDPEANLSAGADYLARLLLKFGDLRFALAAFNGRPGPRRAARARARHRPDPGLCRLSAATPQTSGTSGA